MARTVGFSGRPACLAIHELRGSRDPLTTTDGSRRIALVQPRFGRVRLAQDGRDGTVGVGEFALVDTARPHLAAFPDTFRGSLFTVPSTVLGPRAEDIGRVTAAPIDAATGVASLLRPLLDALAADASDFPCEVAERLARTVTDMLVTLVTEQTGSFTEEPELPELAQRVRRHIDAHLGDPDLGPASVAGAHHISLRSLHLLFEQQGTTVGRWIRRRRLEECARDLASPGGGSAVATVGRRWGFVNDSHFSRAFRAAYEVSPSEWHQAHH
ncbi:helix-turn-helix domain-containing protein [Streptomyces sp. NPDC058469]|uniref:helix-turn-helix domain-containing protein n=1 Tax=Streptomyces sp. NPDC058469 TaxID=3346514 RepID=UPI00364E5C71